jgi:DNA-binding transcriptional LysR family regulator
MLDANLEYPDLKQLDAFGAVMSTGSITGAARLLGRSQPVVTRLIQDLETALGFQLLHRNGPRISPTERGVLFYGEVERLIVGLKHIRERAMAIAEGEPPAFEIAATSALSAGLVPLALASVAPEHLPRKIHLQSMSAEDVVRSVVARSADFGLSSLPVEHPGLELQWIGEAPCVAVVCADHPLAAREQVAMADLSGERIITMANPFRLRRRIDDALRRSGLAPASLIDTNVTFTALAAARAGLGVALVEPASAVGMPFEGLVVRPLDVDIPFLFAAISPFAKPFSRALEMLNDALKTVAAETLPGFRLHDPASRDALVRTIYGARDEEGGGMEARHKEALS